MRDRHYCHQINNMEIEQSKSTKNDLKPITKSAITAFRIGFNMYTYVQVMGKTTIRKTGDCLIH